MKDNNPYIDCPYAEVVSSVFLFCRGRGSEVKHDLIMCFIPVSFIVLSCYTLRPSKAMLRRVWGLGLRVSSPGV